MDIWEIERTFKYLQFACGTFKKVQTKYQKVSPCLKNIKTKLYKGQRPLCIKTLFFFETKKARIAILFHMTC